MKRLSTLIILVFVAHTAQAEYAGPSNVPAMTVKQLLDTGTDDQYATLHGRLVSHDGGKHYTFADDSGKLRVEIEPQLLPAGQTIDAKTRVEISGEFDKDFGEAEELEVKQIKVLP
ncbi:YgiW/YdeI family stress tolerance OB fold protein [Methylomonas koyamae]|uniref:YgiW/YdeI family stress tolerance OB fold protein n=1 Tax=Methylomonas koyamae TaxID=702114 RepID=UPI0006CFC587|nr:NirD/YgiW/YdeI family stress tolerance protein [Methylomonas koyamae]BBL60863.1 hypothetical protein MKFW12EY_44760 [Methylomonas koyamae]